MTYMDSENWECKLPPTSMSLQKVFRMDDGKFSILSFDTEGMVGTAEYAVARSDGIWGGLSHYWQIAEQAIRKHSWQSASQSFCLE